jgi:hypothetical protein
MDFFRFVELRHLSTVPEQIHKVKNSGLRSLWFKEDTVDILCQPIFCNSHGFDVFFIYSLDTVT